MEELLASMEELLAEAMTMAGKDAEKLMRDDEGSSSP